jgi:hypothetical protein
MLFRAEIHICGNTTREQRHHVALVLKRMAEKIVLDDAPLAGSAQVTISDLGQVAGEGWFEASLVRRNVV